MKFVRVLKSGLLIDSNFQIWTCSKLGHKASPIVAAGIINLLIDKTWTKLAMCAVAHFRMQYSTFDADILVF